jgi:Undecaprenyl-phosphate glucose phosphotransferase
MSRHQSDPQVVATTNLVLPTRRLIAVRRWAIPIQCVQYGVCVADIVLIAAANVVMGRLLTLHGGAAETLPFDRLGILAGALFAVIAQLVGAYELPTHMSVHRSVLRAVNAWAGVTLFVLGLGVTLLDIVPVAPRDIYLWSAVCGLVLAAGRIAMVGAIRGLRRRGVFDQRSAVIGTGRQAAELLRYISQHKTLTLSLVGYFDDDAADAFHEHDASLPYLGDLTALLTAIRKGAINRVMIALPLDQESRVKAIVARLSETPVEIRLAPANDCLTWTQNPVAVLGELPVITLLGWPLSRRQRLLKALEDRFLSLIALAILTPMMLIIALAIKLDSPGPVLFRQQRQGFNCCNFAILKFRTMRVAAIHAEHVVQAQRRDPRVTRIGAILRRTSLDELPQLLNVLCGQMSLVGPRPHAPSTRAAGRLFCDIAHTYPARHNVKPGMTGWAQVCGWRGETHSEEQLLRRLEHDLHYVRHWSIWFDLLILARTVAAVLRQHNAY